jgi:uncharacterized protein YrrD
MAESPAPTLITHSDLVGGQVFDRDTTEELGRVETLWMYPQSDRVLGFIVKSGLLGKTKAAVNLKQIRTVGPQIVWTEGKSTATNADRVKQLESLIGLDLCTEGGERIGRIVDCQFNWKTGEIVEYRFATNQLEAITGDTFVLHPAYILSFGKKRVLISDRAAKAVLEQPVGIQRKLAVLKDNLKTEYTQVSGDVLTIAQQAKQTAQTRAKSFSETATEQLEQLSDKAGDRAQKFAQKASKTAHNLTEKAIDKWDELAAELEAADVDRDRRSNSRFDDADDDDFDEIPWADRSPANQSPENQPIDLKPRADQSAAKRTATKQASQFQVSTKQPLNVRFREDDPEAALDDRYDLDDDYDDWVDGEDEPPADRPEPAPPTAPRSPSESQRSDQPAKPPLDPNVWDVWD